MNNHIVDGIHRLVEKTSGTSDMQINQMPLSGSNRLYYRVWVNNSSFIATYNADLLENDAFFYLSNFFLNNNLPVPKVLSINNNKEIYLQEDLGEVTLYSLVENDIKTNKAISKKTISCYKQALDDLLRFQLSSQKGLDFSRCYPVSSFDSRAIQWDLNYFKYMFLKLIHAAFNEQKLEDDFRNLTDFLSTTDNSYFMYRDFQSRNIMVNREKLYYIDFQGGRKGPVFYDVASLLYDAKANLSQELRDELCLYYFSKLSSIVNVEKNTFFDYFHGFVLLRILQALGAYGYRGIYERKQHFIQSIPLALKNVLTLLQTSSLKNSFPYLCDVLEKLPTNADLQSYLIKKSSEKLTITITSFSYKNGIPEDTSGNEGGFVFDCRALPNPAKVEELKFYAGIDSPVKKYMQQFPQVGTFMDCVYQLVSLSIDNYIERGFTHLLVNFGCTGGQHRSVYCAEMLAAYLSSTYTIHVEIKHTNQTNWIKS